MVNNTYGKSGQGFTLIEVMVAMTITIIIILMVANMFSDATTASNSATDRAEMETDGRAALNFMSMKLSQAIAGPAEPSSSCRTFALTAGGDVTFDSVSDAIESNRFYYDGSNIVYCYQANDPATLIGNVVSLKFYAYEKHENLCYAQGDPFNCHLTTNLPYCFDVGIRLISSGDKKKADQLSGISLTNFVASNSRWFSTRVYFQTRKGYEDHKYNDQDN